ncbi:protein translocase subunit SecD [Agromyces sp. ZXT2-6]|uniref:protein translocase subunit SecD n=1 Tax=Agromyces sp. ZXT2-6 TaxID=3461153 RepID=UPI004054BD14
MAAPSKRSSRPTPVRKAWRSLSWLGVIIVALFGINAAGVIWGDGSWAPKLALDLEGGTQIILEPQVADGDSVSQEQLDQAVAIIRQRVDASGVSEAEINTQGGQNVVVAIPGELDEQTRARIESSAKLELRPVLLADAATNQSIDPSASPEPADGAEEELESTPTAEPTDASDPAWITPALQDEFDTFDCAAIDESGANVAPSDEPLVTCDATRTIKYLLGPVEVGGEDIVDATNGMVQTQTGATTGQWAVNIVFNERGAEQFAEVSQRLFALNGQTPRDQFAFVLDGAVLSAPQMNGVITDGRPQVTGSFTQESSKALADQLKFGALPISFEVQSSDTISATLGTSQLQAGLIAGLIGLVLVVIYTLFQYRLLGTVTIASLVIVGVITYLTITILSWREGYRLSLAGIAGLIVAIGFTADSFIVYFERVRDELRDGRPLVGAVEAGWKRALRTILSSKGMNLLAAVVLFILAVGSVRGFAFTLGLTTVIDVLVVILFTHPMLQLLAQTRFFSSGHPWSGLDPKALGAVYRGRAEFRKPVAVPASKVASSSREAQRRQTIAERKAAQVDATVGAGESKES